MLTRFFAIGSIVSALLCAIVIAIWIWTLSLGDPVWWPDTSGFRAYPDGKITQQFFARPGTIGRVRVVWHKNHGRANITVAWWVSLRFAAAALAGLPLTFLTYKHRRKLKQAIVDLTGRTMPGEYCKSCRYNLTGNTSGICPECGLHIAPPAA